MQKIKLLYPVWIIVCIILVVIVLDHKSESTKFYGIADTMEIVVNSENPVEIRKIYFLPGQVVKKGEQLVEFARSELDVEINEISHQIEELKARKLVNTAGLRSRIDELKAQKRSNISEINYRIKQVQAQYNINKKIASEFNSIEKSYKKDKKIKIDNPAKIKIESLKKELELGIKPIQININMLKRELFALENPLKIRLEGLERELNLLLEEKNKLYIFSQITGIIGSVNYKEGEKIPPFTTVMTYHTESPSYVKGFIHENVYNRIFVGMKLEIVSLADNKNRVSGKVVGVGSRIVEFPERLRKDPAVQIWGREVQIKIPEDNDLLLGEKVLISPLKNRHSSGLYIFSRIFSMGKTHLAKTERINHDKQYASKIINIKTDNSFNSILNIEASGVIYLQDLKKYLVISDDTENKRPVLYLMDDKGNITEEVFIQGLKSIDDMEAITVNDDGDIYIACSQSYGKKEHIPDDRKLLIRINREGIILRLDKKVYLHDLLKDAAKRYKKTKWAKFITSGIKSFKMEIEGIFYSNGSMYFGFKRPFKGDKAVILRIDYIDKVLNENILEGKNVTLWREFDLKDKKSEVLTGISDLHFRKNRVFILSYDRITKDDIIVKSGNLWTYDIFENKLLLIKHFKNLKPEGITFNTHKKEFLITFDCGKKQPSKIMKCKNL
ncbi:MAG: hypothetical protein SV062_02400 [Thermodesulfobacteriota bacterium]|nr:hypothetical protein [Thermodesulfobacteriota bacterium]